MTAGRSGRHRPPGRPTGSRNSRPGTICGTPSTSTPRPTSYLDARAHQAALSHHFGVSDTTVIPERGAHREDREPAPGAARPRPAGRRRGPPRSRPPLGQQPDGVPSFPLPGRRCQNKPPVQVPGIHAPMFEKRSISLTPITNPSLTPKLANPILHQIYRITLRVSPWLWFSSQSSLESRE